MLLGTEHEGNPTSALWMMPLETVSWRQREPRWGGWRMSFLSSRWWLLHTESCQLQPITVVLPPPCTAAVPRAGTNSQQWGTFSRWSFPHILASLVSGTPAGSGAGLHCSLLACHQRVAPGRTPSKPQDCSGARGLCLCTEDTASTTEVSGPKTRH